MSRPTAADFSKLTKFEGVYVVEQTVEVRARLGGGPAAVRVEVLRDPRDDRAAYTARGSRLQEVDGHAVWAEYALPQARHESAEWR